jgi:membrane-bound lytic murein transglycosylase D
MTADTAHSLGLWVNILIDERHNEERLTEAVTVQYQELYRRFGNWHLALLAYNTGGRRLEEVIQRAGHADAFRLLEEGALSDVRVNYMGRLMSTLLILKHPELLQD